MTTQKPSRPLGTPPRCIYISRNGRQCRYSAHREGGKYCWVHGVHPDLKALHKLMRKSAGDFRTPDGIGNVLYTLFFATLDGAISERRAGVLAYLAQTILNTQRASVEYEKVMAQRAVEEASASFYRPPEPAAPVPGKPEPEELEIAAQPLASLPQTPPAPAAESSPAEGPKPAAPAVSSAPPKTPPRKPGLDPKPPDLNHFFPRDLTLPPSVQNPETHSPPPPSSDELARRHARFDRANGFRSHPNKRAYPLEHDPDWKIINGR